MSYIMLYSLKIWSFISKIDFYIIFLSFKRLNPFLQTNDFKMLLKEFSRTLTGLSLGLSWLFSSFRRSCFCRRNSWINLSWRWIFLFLLWFTLKSSLLLILFIIHGFNCIWLLSLDKSYLTHFYFFKTKYTIN